MPIVLASCYVCDINCEVGNYPAGCDNCYRGCNSCNTCQSSNMGAKVCDTEQKYNKELNICTSNNEYISFEESWRPIINAINEIYTFEQENAGGDKTISSPISNTGEQFNIFSATLYNEAASRLKTTIVDSASNIILGTYFDELLNALKNNEFSSNLCNSCNACNNCNSSCQTCVGACQYGYYGSGCNKCTKCDQCEDPVTAPCDSGNTDGQCHL